MRFVLGCGAVVLLAACAPSSTAPVKVMAIVPSITGTYETKQIELTTITSITALTGKVVTLVGGTQIVIDPNDPAQMMATTDDQIAQTLQPNRGGAVHANYIDKGGVLWPADFHSWAMVTTYFNFEQSYLYYQRVYDGAPTDTLLGTRVLYWAEFKDLSTGSEQVATDNAFWFQPIRSFVLVPFDKLQKIPFALNVGVVGHEFAHLVFNQKVFANVAVPLPLFGPSAWHLRPFNLLKSMDEGLADFHGYGVTCASAGPGCRPNFLSVSIADKVAVAARDMSDDNHCLTEELRAAFENFQPNAFIQPGLQYGIGTLISTALYQAANKNGKIEIVQKALIASYDDPSASAPGFKQVINLNLANPEKFTPEKMTDTIASHITDPELKKFVCNQLADRLQLMCDSSVGTVGCEPLGAGVQFSPLEHCPSTTTRGTTPCKPLRPR